jgi:YYY domain-containing protein
MSDILIWWLTIQGFGLVGLPLTLFFFRALPDRGYAFSKTLGLLLSGYLAWLLAMLGLAPFGRGLLVICALFVGVIGLLIRREPRIKPAVARADGNKEQSANGRWSLASLKFQASSLGPWKLILAYEALFAAALLFLALLRSYNYQIIINPNPWGTERPMDYALFNAIRSSASFPPHDPWLAGFSINYYYFGYLLMAAMSLVSGVDRGVAYNLSLAVIFALTALGIAGIVTNLIALTTADLDAPKRSATDESGERGAANGGWESPAARPRSPIAALSSLADGRWSAAGGRVGAVVLTVVLVLYAGNQGATLQVVSGTPMVLALAGPDMARAIANGLGPRQPLYLDPPFKGWDFDGTRVITPTNRIVEFDWWPSSRAVWDAYPDPDDPTGQPSRRYTITEFPFFSFWLGDMHPHVMALPFGLLALALALQTIARPAAPTFALGRRGWVELILTGVILGSLYLINSWDVPTYALLFLGSLLLLYVRLGNAGHERGSAALKAQRSKLAGVWWRHYASQAILALLAAGVLFVPFYLTFHSLVGGKDPLINLPILATITRVLGVVTASRTSLQNFLIIFGLMLAPLLIYLVAQSRIADQIEAQPPAAPAQQEPEQTTEPSGSGRTRETPVGFVAQPLMSPSWRYLPIVLLVVLVVGALAGFPLLVLLALAIYAGRLALAHAERPVAAFVLWGFALICLVCFGTEIVYIRDIFEGGSSRMNTIFKFYYQAWLIWGVLAGYALWWLLWRRPTTDERRPASGMRRSNPWPAVGSRWLVILFAVLFVSLLASALAYPLLTAGKAFREGQWVGLAGKTKREETPDDAAAIDWLRANAPPDAVVLEASGGGYDTSGLGYGQVSGSTGLATVLGWTDHEQQWRGGDAAALAQLGPREADVKTIYSAGDVAQARELLRKYGVSYIYVGGAEREAYPQLDMAKLGQLGEPVLQNSAVTIYRVRPQ